MRKLFAALFICALAHPFALQAQSIPVPVTNDMRVSVPVRDDNLVGTWYPPESGKRGPALLVLGGSEGGQEGGKALAVTFAKQGYGVLALAYFRAPGLPQTLQNIPLEYFDSGLAWLSRQPMVDAKRIGVYGISIGGETALVVASRHPELRAVVAAVPSSVIWQGFDPVNYRSVESTYSLAGQGVPYLPYDTSTPYTGIYALYTNSLKKLSQHSATVIPVERIGGAILLLSAKADTVWPSSEMSEQVMARLKAHSFRHTYHHFAYPDAGHAAMLPPGEGPVRNSGFDNLGGTEAGNAAAREAMWRETIAFLDNNLGKPALVRTGTRR